MLYTSDPSGLLSHEMATYSQATLRGARKFIRQPDRYYFDGGQHSPLGYSEQQYSLPRWIDLTVSRQGLLDDVWTKPAVLGWMFLPMKPYHAGGDGASFEPYSEHLQSYDFALSQYLGSGCGMTYRGDKLYVSVPTTLGLSLRWLRRAVGLTGSEG